MLTVVSINERNRLNMNGMMNASLEFTNVIEGYVSEVLHREYLNIMKESLMEQLEAPLPMPAVNQTKMFTPVNNTVTLTPSSNTNNINLNSANNINISNLSLNSTTLNNAKIVTMNTNKPQIIKLQPYVPQPNGSPQVSSTSISLQQQPNQQQQHHQPAATQTITANMLSSSPMAKQVIYMSQSPAKSGKMIKLPNNIGLIQPQQSANLIATGQELKSEQMEHQFSSSDKNVVTLQQLKSAQNGFVQIQQQQQAQNQVQQSPQHQQQQVLNLVLVTDGVNGGVSYLSLVPQN